MNLLAKFEQLFNHLCWLVAKYIKMFILAIIPKKLQLLSCKLVWSIFYPIEKVKEKVAKLDANIRRSAQTLKQKGKDLSPKDLINKQKDKVTKASNSTLVFFKNTTPKAITALVIGFFLTPWKKILLWTSNLTSYQIVIGSIVGAASVMAGIAFYSSAQGIAEKTYREPAAIKKVWEKRPPYYKISSRQIKFSNIKMPIYVEGKTSMQLVTIDVTLKGSNRYAIKYLEKKHYEFKDLLLSKLEPIIPSFPLVPEGKSIIKQKVKQEVDLYLKNRHIDGAVDEVFIEYLMGV